MKSGSRYSTSRQKVCENCAAAKAKCDRGFEQCSRCATRGIRCVYPSFSANTGSTSKWNETADTHVSFASERKSSSKYAKLETLDFGHVSLRCPINVDDIQNRWLNAFVPVSGQRPKQYPAVITTFISNNLNSFVSVASRGRTVPSFIHKSQVRALSTMPPLSTCLSLVRMCERPVPGSESTVADLLRREMASLYTNRTNCDNLVMLAAFQAFLIYAMSLFYKLGQGSHGSVREAMMNLQDLAGLSCRQGLVCNEELQRVRPSWEAWIIAEAKRRTLFTMYLFDGVLSSIDGLPTYLGTELQGLSAPASKDLWEADTRDLWEISYSLHLADWPTGQLRIDELWPMSEDADESATLDRRNRVDRWLEDVDSYGMMLYAVTSCTHGS